MIFYFYNNTLKVHPLQKDYLMCLEILGLEYVRSIPYKEFLYIAMSWAQWIG